MALLEKQRLLNKSKAVVSKPKPKPNTNISVTIANDLCKTQSKSDGKIVQLNGIDATLRKVNELETAATHVDPETPLDKNKVSTATVTVTNSVITNNISKKPNKCVTPDETPSTPEKSFNLEPNLSTLSTPDKRDVLQKSEAEYMRHR